MLLFIIGVFSGMFTGLLTMFEITFRVIEKTTKLDGQFIFKVFMGIYLICATVMVTGVLIMAIQDFGHRL